MESPFASIRKAVDDAEAAWLAAVGAPDADCLTGTHSAQVDAMSDVGIVAVNALDRDDQAARRRGPRAGRRRHRGSFRVEPRL